MTSNRRGLTAALLAAGLLAGMANAQPTPGRAAALGVPPPIEAQLRKNLLERVPSLERIDEVRRTPVPGLYEVRVDTEIFYTDAEGSHVINGQMIDTRTKKNLTEERLDKLLAISFDALPLKDAFTIVRGNGKRRMAIFEDPNCGYCKRLERDLQKLENVTIHVFLYPILGPDSTDKSRNIWCTRDKGRTWTDWMMKGEAAPKADSGCDVAALARNVEFGKKFKITGTPTLVFADGTRVPGAIAAADIEKLLAGK